MLVCRCPRCDAPTGLSLAEATISCSSCGYEGPPPDEVSEARKKAATLARELDVKERQLDRWQQRLVASSVLSVVVYVVAIGVVVLPLAGIALLALWMTMDGLMSWDGLVVFAAPAVIASVAAAAGVAWIQRSRRALRSAAAAIPPATTGGTASCRVCGAPLPTTTEAVARCGFCESDNLVSADALARAGRKRLDLREDLAETTRAAATEVGRASRRAGCVAAGVGCAAPLVVLGAAGVLVLVLTSIETELDGDATYAVVQTPAGACVAHVNVFDDHVRLSYGGRTAEHIQPEDRPSAAGLELRSPAFLRGRRVRVHNLRRTGTVVRVHGTLAGTVTVVVRTDEGQELDVVPQGLCLLDEPPSPSPSLPAQPPTPR